MNHKVTLLDDDDFDLNDELPEELDFTAITPDMERTRRFRIQAVARQLLDADVLEFFKTPEAINAALRQVMSEQRKAA